MFWELYQQGRIAEANDAAADARSAAQAAYGGVDQLNRRLKRLEEHVDRLALGATALFEILRDRQGISQADLETKIQEIDLRDGKLDGKLAQAVEPCPNCQRVNAPHRAVCLYCGKPLPKDEALFGS